MALATLPEAAMAASSLLEYLGPRFGGGGPLGSPREPGCLLFDHPKYRMLRILTSCLEVDHSMLTTAHDCSRLLTTPQACDSCSACICCQDMRRHILLSHRDSEAFLLHARQSASRSFCT